MQITKNNYIKGHQLEPIATLMCKFINETKVNGSSKYRLKESLILCFRSLVKLTNYNDGYVKEFRKKYSQMRCKEMKINWSKSSISEIIGKDDLIFDGNINSFARMVLIIMQYKEEKYIKKSITGHGVSLVLQSNINRSAKLKFENLLHKPKFNKTIYKIASQLYYLLEYVNYDEDYVKKFKEYYLNFQTKNLNHKTINKNNIKSNRGN